MSESSSSPKRPRVDYDDSSGKEDHLDKYKNRDREHDDQSIFASSKQQRKRSDPDEDDGKDDDGKTKSVTIETARREHTLVMRLTNKEQELQDCMNQIQEMKQAQTQNTAQLRSMLLDPAINLVFQRMAKEMDEHKEKLKQKQNELSAWKFTPDSQIGKRMMARCRLLLQENADLGKMISSGRTARLEGEIVLHKALVTEMKKNQKELDEFVGELEEDVEGMQGMIFMLQQQLKEAHDQIAKLQRENDQLRTLRMHPDTEPGGSFDGNSNSNTPLHNWTTDASHESEPDSTASKLLISSTQSGKDAGIGVSENVTKKASPVLPSALLTLSDRNRTCATPSDQLSVAQNCEDFTSGTFAFKVTPDSGVQTQEEEDISMDTTDFTTSSLNQQQTCGSDPHRIHSNSHLSSRTIVENAGNNILKKEINSSQTETDRGSISSSTFTHQKSGFPSTTTSDESLRTITSTKSSKSSSDNSSKPLQTLRVSSASERTTERSSFPSAILNTAEGGQRNRHTEQDGRNIDTGRTKRALENRYEKTSTIAAAESETEGRTYGDGVIDENKSALHDSLGLNSVKLEDDKTECQLKLGLVNGSSSLQSQGL